ncbi:hypothetical protein Y602_4584 [Burkholderia pseudomallei MSHR733]|nr:hypothetical protein Y602_4584 [Burkholderia pseudomallei MSHR733]
MYLHPTTR